MTKKRPYDYVLYCDKTGAYISDEDYCHNVCVLECKWSFRKREEKAKNHRKYIGRLSMAYEKMGRELHKKKKPKTIEYWLAKEYGK